MAFINADRVKETTITIGTGNIALLGAVSGFRAFHPTLSVGADFKYFMVSTSGTEWEAGLGTVVSATTLARTTVQSSSNGNAAVNFSAGLKEVGIGPTAGGETPWNPVNNTLDISVDALNDVAITSPTSGQVIKYSGTAWTNQPDAVNVGTVTSVAATGGTGISVTGSPITGAGTLAITNTAPDQTVSLTAGTGISATGTYPNFTVGLGSLTSAQLASALTDETGTGAAVFATSPTLVTPLSNTLSAIPVTGPSAGNSLTIAAGSGVTSGAGGSLILQAGIQATTGGDGKVVVKQVAGQTSNLQEWQDNNGAALASLATTGRMTVPYLNATGGTYSAASPALVLGTGTGFYYSNPNIYFCAGNNSQIYMNPSGGNLLVNVNGQPGSTSGQVVIRPGNGGGAQVNCLVVQSNPNQGSYLMYTVTGHGAMTIAPDVPSVSCATLNGSATHSLTATTKSLTSNVATITVSGGTPRIDVGDTVVVALSPADAVFDGTYTISAKSGNNLSYARTNTNVTSTATAGTVSSTATATLQNINIGVPGAKGSVIKGSASQTANLQEWQNSAGTVLASVSAAGSVAANAITATSVTSGAGNSLTIAAGSGIGTGNGANLVLAPGEFATSGTRGTVLIDGLSVGKGKGTGTNNTVFGDGALAALTTGIENTGFGLSALGSVTTGYNNTAFGNYALSSVVTGFYNTCFGRSALLYTTGNYNTACGSYAGRSCSTGNNNTFLGWGAGYTGQLASAVNSMALGYQAITTADNQVVIGNTNVTQTVLRGCVNTTVFLVATLTAAATAGAGARAFVSDSNATTFAAVVAGGGANGVPVYSDGTNWRIG